MPVYLRQITTGHFYVFNPRLATRADMQPFECPEGGRPIGIGKPAPILPRVESARIDEETQAGAPENELPVFTTLEDEPGDGEIQAGTDDPPSEPAILDPPRTRGRPKKPE